MLPMGEIRIIDLAKGDVLLSIIAGCDEFKTFDDLCINVFGDFFKISYV
jgi:hypothetical protein